MRDKPDASRERHSWDSRILRLRTFWQLFPLGYMLFWVVLLLLIYAYQGGFPESRSRTQGWIGFWILFLLSAGLGWLIAVFFSFSLAYEISSTGIAQRRFLRAPLSMDWQEIDSVRYFPSEDLEAFELHAGGRKLDVITGIEGIDFFAEMALNKIPRDKWTEPKVSLVAAHRFAGRPIPFDLRDDSRAM